MRIVEVYKEIQEQEMNIVSTFVLFFFIIFSGISDLSPLLLEI